MVAVAVDAGVEEVVVGVPEAVAVAVARDQAWGAGVVEHGPAVARRCRGRRRPQVVHRLSAAVVRDRIQGRTDLRLVRSAAVRARVREPARSAGIGRGRLRDPAASVREDQERASPAADDQMQDS